ncbi:MAG: pyridoxal 5'-phosphate synthase glutaminase subunit PdxT [Candidatus Peregrinibacteria bacterium]
MQKPPAQTSGLIGILALQGSFAEHSATLEKLGVQVKLIRSLADVQDVTACILPGGESTVIMKLLKSTGLDQWLTSSAKAGMSIYGTCAGLIVLANLKLLYVRVSRNAYGPQLYSFEDQVRWGKEIIPGIFIRAPHIISTGLNVQILATHDKNPVLVRQKNILACTFHPELTQNTKVHEYFCRMANCAKIKTNEY